MMPCGSGGQQALVCTQLKDIAKDAAELCAKAGFRMSAQYSSEPCFDGKAPEQLPPSCKVPAPAAATPTSKGSGREVERKARSRFQRGWRRFVRKLYRRLQGGKSALVALGVAIVIMYGIPMIRQLARTLQSQQQGLFLNDGDYDARFPGRGQMLGGSANPPAERTNKHKKRM